MIGGDPRRTGALAAVPARPHDEIHDDGTTEERHLRLVAPIDRDESDGIDDTDARARRVRRSSPMPKHERRARPDDRLVGIVAAAATPQMLAAVVAFAGHALVLRDLGVASFGSLILVQALATALIGLGAVGVPGLLRSSPDLSLDDADATSRWLGRFQLPAVLIAVVGVGAASVALVDTDVVLPAGLFAVAAAAAVRSASHAGVIERNRDHRSGAAAALGSSVIWLAVLLATIEAGSVEYALPIAAAVAELVRTLGSWRLIVAIRRGLDAEKLEALDTDAEQVVPAPVWGAASAIRFLPAGAQTALVMATGLLVVALLGDATDLGMVAVGVVVLRLVLMLEPAIASLGSSFVRPETSLQTDRAWRRAARLSDAVSVPVAVGSVTAFVIGAPAIARLVGIETGTVAAAVGLLLLSAPATQFLQIGDLALRSSGRHVLGNALLVMRLAAVGGLGTAGWLAFEQSGEMTGVLALAAAWAIGEWLALTTVVLVTGWRPLDRPSIATLIVIAAVGAGLFATGGFDWNPPRLALASVLLIVLFASAPRTVAQLRRIDTTAARHLDRRAPTT